jgi:hypothetical protein
MQSAPYMLNAGYIRNKRYLAADQLTYNTRHGSGKTLKKMVLRVKK